MTLDLSFCIVTRDDEHLDKTVASIRATSAEVCVLYTGYDGKRAEHIQGIADRFDWSTACNDSDQDIADFSLARGKSFALATRRWTAWLDSDDLLVGAEQLDAVLGCAHDAGRPRLLAEYVYASDPDTGEPSVVQWRERIIRTGSPYVWKRPVHEHLVAVDGRNEDFRIQQPVGWVHAPKSLEQRHAAVARNLRILRRHAAELGDAADSDAWLQYNLGAELQRAGEYAQASMCLGRYVELSGRDDEKVRAMIKLAECAFALDPSLRVDDAMVWAKRARDLNPDAFEPHHMIAKLRSIRGMVRGDEESLRLANADAQRALRTPPADTPLEVLPTDRSHHIHELIRVNAETLEDWPTALAAADAALAARPNDAPMKLARRRYGALLKMQAADEATGGIDVVIVCGASREPWNPEIAAKTGIGGSETAVIEMSKRLAAKGYRVRVFCDCGRPGLYDGVEYTNDLSDVTECDVLIAWRSAHWLESISARVKLIWAHDIGIHNATEWNLGMADGVLALSQWHKGSLLKLHGKYGLTAEKIVVTRNGIDLTRFAPPVELKGVVDFDEGTCVGTVTEKIWTRNPHKAVYSSSADRGLEVLLDLWPRVRAQVPDAELHVFYGRRDLEASEAEDIEAKIKATEGVVDRGRVDQKTLAREMLSAGVWPFPSWTRNGPWTETSCISAMEAQAAGLQIVAGPYGAIPETVFSGSFVFLEPTEPEYAERFAEKIVKSMTRMSNYERDEVAFTARQSFSWDGVADRWDLLLQEMLTAEKAA
jgi:glycosyltransferase involved in cell wall biosynthesis